MSPAEILLMIQGARMAMQLGQELWTEFERRGELTPEEVEAYKAEREKMFAQPHWKVKTP